MLLHRSISGLVNVTLKKDSKLKAFTLLPFSVVNVVVCTSSGFAGKGIFPESVLVFFLSCQSFHASVRTKNRRNATWEGHTLSRIVVQQCFLQPKKPKAFFTQPLTTPPTPAHNATRYHLKMYSTFLFHSSRRIHNSIRCIYVVCYALCGG